MTILEERGLFAIELNNHSEALTSLYQMLLLHEIGIDKKILHHWVFDGFQSYPIKVHLAQVGLIDKSIVEPKSSKSMSIR